MPLHLIGWWSISVMSENKCVLVLKAHTLKQPLSHSCEGDHRRCCWFCPLQNAPNLRNFCRSHKQSNKLHWYTYNKNRRTHTLTQRLVSIFRVPSETWSLNLEGHFVKQIQHQHVGRLSKHADHVFPSVHVFMFIDLSCRHYTCVWSTFFFYSVIFI